MANDELRFAAGTVYINGKATGVVIGQQPFGVTRTSRAPNDKARVPSQPAAVDCAPVDQGDLPPRQVVSLPVVSLPAHGYRLKSEIGH